MSDAGIACREVRAVDPGLSTTVGLKPPAREARKERAPGEPILQDGLYSNLMLFYESKRFDKTTYRNHYTG